MMSTRNRKGDYGRSSAKRQLDRIYKRYEGVCQLCGKKLFREEATREHKIPLWQGGSREDHNTVLACGPCNFGRARKTNPHPHKDIRHTSDLVKRAIWGTIERQRVGVAVVRWRRQVKGFSFWGPFERIKISEGVAH